MANNGLPRNGLVALYDPWRDTYGRNILPVGSENFVTGWSAYNSSVITVTQNQTVAEWNTTKATRVQATAGAGTDALKYFVNAGFKPVLNTQNRIKVLVKNIGSDSIRVFSNVGIDTAVSVLGGTVKEVVVNSTGNGTSGLHLQFLSNIATNGFDILVYQPQINIGTLYPYSPPAYLPQSLTDYTGHANNAQLGSAAGADTNDPKFNGVALVGDGVDDYAVVPLASAAYRISVVDSGSGYTVVDEVPAYLNLFKTGAATYLNGKIGPTAYYNRVPTAAEIAQAKRYFKRLMAQRGVTVS